jgi:hypothetical protein
MKHAALAAALSVCALAVPAAAGAEGKPLPSVEMKDFAQIGARSFGDLTGRLVLIEFFAYW